MSNKGISIVENSEIAIVTEESIRDKIYYLRGQRVMLDFELAEIYGYSTSRFNEQVKNNIEKFDSDFMFKLTSEEFSNLISKKSTSSWGGRRKPPNAFTERGLYMLMTILKGELATQQSKALIRLFTNMKDFIVDNQGLIGQDEVNRLTLQNTADIAEIKNTMATKDDLTVFMKNFNNNHIGKEYLILNGKTVESDIAYKNIYALAKKSIYIVDDYIGIKTLLLLKDVSKSVEIIIFSDNKQNHLTKQEYDDFCTEYPGLDISFKKTENKFHDRYIFLDYASRTFKVYHCGASSKDGGKKTMSIELINDKGLYKPVITGILNNPDLTLQ